MSFWVEKNETSAVVKNKFCPKGCLRPPAQQSVNDSSNGKDISSIFFSLKAKSEDLTKEKCNYVRNNVRSD